MLAAFDRSTVTPCRTRNRRLAHCTMVDLSEYTIGEPAERLDRYVPGGYHPVHLHDKLKGGRYEIVGKLGFGAFSTVWLARDNECMKVNAPWGRDNITERSQDLLSDTITSFHSSL